VLISARLLPLDILERTRNKEALARRLRVVASRERQTPNLGAAEEYTRLR
jgi:hypothetical protein